ncbi:HTH-type transcriptional regulator CynR [Pigmentiphaga humi]|uniref:HTH-type transcriptional regulator CynR n=1 Tax=Pigmentiphaga humi TaxID=2478468 RepID=A0A3P4AYR2_9BURK|nr:LysR family transcriptional regulator [Pigmentiphaga humi]VCU68701.1 HTH-type transcriptional regulator CynR [Pigmentiphaga humi]
MSFHASLGNLSLKQLRAFACVAESRSFTTAAALLNLSQSAVSLLVRELESELGLKLLDRTTRSVRMTEAGAELHPVATRVLQDLGAAVAGSRELADRRRGRVRFACSPLQSALLVPRIIGAFKEHHPHITMVLRDTPGGEIVDLVAKGEVDLAVGVLPVDTAFIHAELLQNDDLLLIYPRSYGWSPRHRATWKDLTDHPFIALGEHNSTRYLVDYHAAQVGVRLTPACEVAFVWTAIGLVEAGQGVSVIPGHARTIVQKFPEVGMLPFESRKIRRPIALLRHRHRTLSPAAAAFAAFLQERFPRNHREY